MEIIKLITVSLFVKSASSSLSKCCPLNFELSVNTSSSNFGRENLTCKSSTVGTLGITYTSHLRVGFPECHRFQLIDAYDRSEKVFCVDRVSERNDVFGVSCFDHVATNDSFLLPSITSFRKCCPLNRKYDAEKQFCWSQFSRDYSGATNDLLKITLRQSDRFVNVTVGVPKCRTSEVLLDTLVPNKQVSFLYDSIVLNDSNKVLRLGYDEFCADIVDDIFEYVIVRSCRSYFAECTSGSHVCVRKCCQSDYEYDGRVCVPSHRPLSLMFQNVSADDEGKHLFPGNIQNVIRPAFLQGNVCKVGKYYLDDSMEQDKHVLTVEGMILMLATKEMLNVNEYCVENKKSQNKTKTFVCFPEKPAPADILKVKRSLTTIFSAISAMFLFLTFIIYLILPSLKNQHGKLIMCYLVTSAMGYTILVVQHTLPFEKLPEGVCQLSGYIMLFTFLSSFCWLNIISYDIWSTFKAVNSSFLRKSKRCKKFLMCCLYGWGYPLVLIGMTAVYQFTMIIDKFSKWKPDIGRESCWFSNQGKSKIIFFVIPISMMISFNLILFVLTVKYCADIRKALKLSNNNYSFQKYNSNKHEFLINIKLFMVMGINWSTELVSLLVQPESRSFFIASDLINALGGTLIFCIFIMKRKVLHDLKIKLRGRIFEHDTNFTTSTTSSVILSMMHSRKSVSNVP